MEMTWDDNAQSFCGLHADGAKLASVATAADFNNVITALGESAYLTCDRIVKTA